MTEVPTTHRATILIIEDDPQTVDTFDRMFRSEGYGVRSALDAASGWAEVEQASPDAILLDLHLPITDGVAFLRRLRSTPQHARIPVALMTADYLLEEGVARELQALGAQIRFKPLWQEDLVQIARDLLQSAPPLAKQR